MRLAACKPRAFCDLDNTLIYSARLATGRWPHSSHLITVEHLQGRPAAVMPRDAAALWTALVASDALVPTTTRTTDQYTALALPGDRPRIAITGNGADILRDGRPDPSWRRHVEHTIAATAAPFGQVAKALEALADATAVLGCPYPADRLYFILGTRTPPIPDELLAEIIELTQPLGWRAVAYGRRMYVLPAVLDKHLAVEQVVAESGADVVLAAGDSELDEEMLTAATAAIRPPHGALHQRGWAAPHCTVAASAGLTASQEILQWFATQLRDVNDDAADG